MAWQAISGNKMRSFLTMLGIIIGVLALVVTVSLVTGATGAVTGEIEALGSNQLTAYVFTFDKPIHLSDMDSIAKDPAIAEVSAVKSLTSEAKHGRTTLGVQLQGTTAFYREIAELTLAYGRFIRTADVRNGSLVAVLTYDSADELFGRQDIVGETFTLAGRRFTVVGVLEKPKSTFASMTYSYEMYVPFSVVSRLAGNSNVTTICVSGVSKTDSNMAAEAALTSWLDHHFGEPDEDDEEFYYVSNVNSIMDSVSTVTDTMELLLGGIAAISLLVGGIGIMNIMLVSVTERTHEIGIRKAIGAGRGSIMLQFLIEALMVSLFGCTIGLVLSSVALQIISMIAAGTVTVSFTMTPRVVITAVGFSSAVGLIFGLYPANKAAKMAPIDALRYQG